MGKRKDIAGYPCVLHGEATSYRKTREAAGGAETSLAEAEEPLLHGRPRQTAATPFCRRLMVLARIILMIFTKYHSFFYFNLSSALILKLKLYS